MKSYSIDMPRSSSLKTAWQPWLVCFSAALFFFFEFIQLNMFNAIGPGLMKDFGIKATVLAEISDKYFLANIIFLFPAGMILDRVSTRRTILIALFVSILCTFGFAIATAVWQLMAFRFITGVAGSFCFLSCVRLASRWFEPRQMALVIGLVVTFAMMGGMVAQTPLTVLTEHFGWQTAVVIDASAGLVMLLLVFLFVKDRPDSGAVQDDHGAHSLTGRAFWLALKRTLLRRQNWLGGLYTSLMNLPIFLLGAIWGIFYLTQIHGLSRAEASVVTLMLFVGTIIGSPVVGWISDFMRSRKVPMIVGAIFSLLLILALIYVPDLSLFSLIIIFFGVGFFTSTQIISYPLIAESNPLSLTATAEGMASVLIMAGGYTQVFFAYLMQRQWHSIYVHGIPVYTLSEYRLALSIMPIAFIIALVFAFIVKDTRCKAFKEDHE